MAAYDPAARPTQAQVANHLTRLMIEAGWEPRLDRLARRHVVPHLADLALTRPEQHPAWDALQFLQAPTGQTPHPPPPRRIDVHLHRLLSQEGWHHDVASLRRTLVIDPSWTPEPFLDALDRLVSSRPWWRSRSWDRDPRVREPILAILDVLRSRPSEAVRRRVRSLLRHRDPEISELARLLCASP